ncbi:LytTR family transcriptional regulator DNA-binding domain-containing protein [Halalkalibacter alkalisediminis]|uniref:LytTR family transcriptional regulator DNA-binding domain-containing protein n=1 Tax=Halalkalibacter alkalisediminis TaxID=935616 RepID=A0ABV6NJ69_9BACI|nr:LytTR family transcriptional regulator DNA-binding domain-containing protein [Halalkalibacter alkalisediminis]
MTHQTRSDLELKFVIQHKGAINIINSSEISYIERYNRKTVIHLINQQKIECNKSLKSIYETIKELDFYRSHQSYIVNLKQVERIQIDTITREYLIKLKSTDALISLSKHNYQELRKKINDLFNLFHF